MSFARAIKNPESFLLLPGLIFRYVHPGMNVYLDIDTTHRSILLPGNFSIRQHIMIFTVVIMPVISILLFSKTMVEW